MSAFDGLLDMTALGNPSLSGRVIRLTIERRIVSRPTLDDSRINFKTVSNNQRNFSKES